MPCNQVLNTCGAFLEPCYHLYGKQSMITYFSHLQVYDNMLQYTGLACDMSVRSWVKIFSPPTI